MSKRIQIEPHLRLAFAPSSGRGDELEQRYRQAKDGVERFG